MVKEWREIAASSDLAGHPALPPMPQTSVSADWFERPICLNCGADVSSAYCGACGQKVARRFTLRDFGKEGWERLRLFELRLLRTAARLLIAPGTVAREFVLGRRTSNAHPLTLLIALVALLVVMLSVSRYFAVYDFPGRNADVDRMAQRVMAYANWSFSLGIFAVFAASWTVFRRRMGYNAVEHAVLAIYCQNAILIVVLVNLLPTLIWHDPIFVIGHKRVSRYALPLVKLLIVGVAFRQFFLIRSRRQWLWLAVACVIFAALGWVLTWAYAGLVLWLVTVAN